jgi:hypothetical protein
VLFTLIRKGARLLMPHEVLAIMIKHLEETGATKDQGKAWDFVTKWCIVVAQKDAQGDSLVVFTVKATTEGGDSYFKQWVEQQLNATMGVGPAQETRGGTAMIAQSTPVPAQFAAELGKELAMGLELLGPLQSPTLSQGGHADTDTKQGYSNENIAALMGFCSRETQEPTTYYLGLFQLLLGQEYQHCPEATLRPYKAMVP